MGNYEQLKKVIIDAVYPNGKQKITGQIMQSTLLSIINAIAKNALFAGVATPGTTPGTPDENVFYLAGPGTYPNFGGAVVTGVSVFTNTASGWESETILEVAKTSGDAENVVMSQKAVTELFKNAEYVDITSWSDLDKLKDVDNCGLYTIKKGANPVGSIFISSDFSRHVINQTIISNLIIRDDGSVAGDHKDGKVTIMYRCYNIASPFAFVPVGTWSKWQYIGEVLQTPGDSTTATMSQKAITEQIENVRNLTKTVDTLGRDTEGFYVTKASLIEGQEYVINVVPWEYTSTNPTQFKFEIGYDDNGNKPLVSVFADGKTPILKQYRITAKKAKYYYIFVRASRDTRIQIEISPIIKDDKFEIGFVTAREKSIKIEDENILFGNKEYTIIGNSSYANVQIENLNWFRPKRYNPEGIDSGTTSVGGKGVILYFKKTKEVQVVAYLSAYNFKNKYDYILLGNVESQTDVVDKSGKYVSINGLDKFQKAKNIPFQNGYVAKVDGTKINKVSLDKKAGTINFEGTEVGVYSSIGYYSIGVLGKYEIPQVEEIDGDGQYIRNSASGSAYIVYDITRSLIRCFKYNLKPIYNSENYILIGYLQKKYGIAEREIYSLCLNGLVIDYNETPEPPQNESNYDAIMQSMVMATPDQNGKLQTPPCVFLHISDVHGNGENIKRMVDFYHKYKTTKYAGNDYFVGNREGIIADMINTGDNVRNTVVLDGVEADYSWYIDNGGGAMLNALGNHDTRTQNTGESYIEPGFGRENSYRKFFKPFISSWDVVQPTEAENKGKNYYYKDYTVNKVRLIVLDSMYFDDECNTWLSSVLEDARTKGFAVVCACHVVPADVTPINCTYDYYPLKAYYGDYPMAKAVTSVQNFVDAGGVFVMWLCGHNHYDNFGVIKSNPKQTVCLIASGGTQSYKGAPQVPETSSQDNFNVISIDTFNHVVKLAKIGCKYDALARRYGTMLYDYTTQKVINNG